MLITEDAIRMINDNLKKGFDIEIQRQKNGVKILKYRREVFYKTQNENCKESSANK